MDNLSTVSDKKIESINYSTINISDPIADNRIADVKINYLQ